MPMLTLAQTTQVSTEPRLVVWLVGAGLLFSALVVLFAYLLMWGRGWLAGGFDRLDAWMAAAWPQRWRAVRGRLAAPVRRGLGPLVLAVVALALTLAFAAVAESWREQEALYALDRAVHGAVTDVLQPPALALLRAVTHAGDVLAVLGVSLLAAALLYRRAAWTQLWALTFTIVGGQALVWGLKWVFGRARPGGQLVGHVGQSFPSGHALSSTVLYGFLIYLLWRWTRRTAYRVAGTVLLSLLVAGVCLSRVLLSVHWTTDVLGGLLLGMAWLLVSILLAHVLPLPGSPSSLGRSTLRHGAVPQEHAAQNRADQKRATS